MKNARIIYKIYSRLLKLYPHSYRQTFGTEMMQTFLDSYRDVLQSEGRVRMGFWLSMLTDEIQNIVRQHGATLAEDKPFSGITAPKLAAFAVLFLPLYAVFCVALVRVSLALPHPPVSGVGVMLAMAALLLVPGLLGAAASCGIMCAFASLYRKNKVKVA